MRDVQILSKSCLDMNKQLGNIIQASRSIDIKDDDSSVIEESNIYNVDHISEMEEEASASGKILENYLNESFSKRFEE